VPEDDAFFLLLRFNRQQFDVLRQIRFRTLRTTRCLFTIPPDPRFTTRRRPSSYVRDFSFDFSLLRRVSLFPAQQEAVGRRAEVTVREVECLMADRSWRNSASSFLSLFSDVRD
jgi:hypothetical protein